MARLHPPSSKSCEHLTPHSPALPLLQLFFCLVLVETFGTLLDYALPQEAYLDWFTQAPILRRWLRIPPLSLNGETIHENHMFWETLSSRRLYTTACLSGRELAVF